MSSRTRWDIFAALVFGMALAAWGADVSTAPETDPTPATAAESKASNPEEPKKPSGFDVIRIKGDFRYRNEGIYVEDMADRNRHRFRARIGIGGEVFEGFDVTLQLATGSDDPVSTNQTLGDSFSTKDIRLDLACFVFGPEALKGLSVTGGKMKNVFFWPAKSELIWDVDLNPEGLAASFALEEGKSLSAKATAAGFWIEERSSDKDSWFAGIQAEACLALAEGTLSARLGTSFFHYENLKNLAPLVEDDDGFGNTLDAFPGPGGTTLYRYANGYNLIEGFAEVAVKTKDVKGVLIADVVFNRSAEEDRTGWLVGLYGSFPCGLAARVVYRVLEKDAVVGAFTDSDFIGGGTDGKGFEFGADWEIVKHAKASISFFQNTAPIEHGKTYRRLQIDLALKF